MAEQLTAEQLNLQMREKLTTMVHSYEQECESRSLASLFEQIGIPFTLASITSFLSWPILAVVVGPMGVAVAVLTAGGAAAYGLWAFSTQSKTIVQQKDYSVLSEADQKALAPKAEALTHAVKIVQTKLAELEGAKKPSPQDGGKDNHTLQREQPSETSKGENGSGGTEPGPKSSTENSQADVPDNPPTLLLLPVLPVQLDPAAPHLLLLGGTREGKTEALRYLLRDAQRVHYLTTKVTDEVPLHWQGYYVGGTEKIDQLIWFMDSWQERLNEHLTGADTEPEWFVADEAISHRISLKNVSTDLAKRWTGLMMETCTAGAAVGAFSAILCQTKNSGPIGLDLDILQQNYSVVTAVKRKRNLAFAVFEKMAGVKLTEEQRAQALALPGYYQLWMQETGDPALSQLEPVQVPTKPVEPCPVPPPKDEVVAGSVPASTSAVADESGVLDWEAIATELCTTPPKTGLRRSMAMVLQQDPKTMTGVKWQTLRDGLKAALPHLPPEVRQLLKAKYRDVDLGS